MSSNKYCTKCGVPIKLSADYCTKCGAKQPPFIDRNSKIYDFEELVIENNNNKISFKEAAASFYKKHIFIHKRKIILVSILFALMIISAFVLISYANDTVIDAKTLFRYDISGGRGTATLSGGLAYDPLSTYYYDYMDTLSVETNDISDVDDETIGIIESQYSVLSSAKKEIYENMKYSKYLSLDEARVKRAFGNAHSKEEATAMRDIIISEVEFEFSKSSQLNNGDKIIVKVKYNKMKLREKNIRLKNTEFEIVIKDLPEEVYINIFDGLKFSFSGYNGAGIAELSEDNCIDFVRDNFYFRWSETNLHNGDSINVFAYMHDKISYDSSIGGVVTDDYIYYFDFIDGAGLVQEVSGLSETTEINPFDFVELEYTCYGDSLEISAVINDDAPNEIIGDIVFRVEVNSNTIRDGDEVVVIAVDQDNLLPSKGYSLSKELEIYNCDFTKLPDEFSDKEYFNYAIQGIIYKSSDDDHISLDY